IPPVPLGNCFRKPHIINFVLNMMENWAQTQLPFLMPHWLVKNYMTKCRRLPRRRNKNRYRGRYCRNMEIYAPDI
uniref:Uncharacterized protein n=1 Tax=Phasianus colchicus TaxID=9054 RepID=A0A669PQ75_PHACC